MIQSRKLMVVALAGLGALALAACSSSNDSGSGSGGGGGGGVAIGESAQIRTDPPERISFSNVVIGSAEIAFSQVMIENKGGQDLVVHSIDIEENDSNPEFSLSFEVPRFRAGDKEGQKIVDVLDEEVCETTANFHLPQDVPCFFFLLYEPTDRTPDFGTITINSNDPVVAKKAISIETLGSGPQIALLPPENLTFDDVLQGSKETKTLLIKNVGTADLEVSDIELVNNAGGDFSIEYHADSPHTSLPATLAPQDEADFVMVDVTYQPSRAGNDAGQIRVRSNDEARPEVVLDLVARSIFPCVQVTPLDIDFRQVLIGSFEEVTVDVTNCGNADLEVGSLKLVEGTSTDFELMVQLDGLDDACISDRDSECTGSAIIGGNATKSFLVRYAPTDEGADGGRIALSTNVSGSEEVEVNLFGRGTNNEPPECFAEARIAGAQEWGTYPDEDQLLETIPLKTIELRGTNSHDPDGSIVAYKWQVVQRPEDSTAQIAPHEGAPEATFFLDLAGEYRFELEVTDNYGQSSHPACQVVVEAIPDEDIHIQLVWDTPADPDQTDTGFGAGSDVDLHLLHPLGDWFCAPRDSYYANPNPDWAVPFDPSDDPSLDIDDTDGAGPENINLNHPENNRVYRVGVHYFNDHGYGPSFVTVRIFIQGVLRFELANKRMAGTDQFWDVATIAWPTGHITPIDDVLDAPPNEECE